MLTEAIGHETREFMRETFLFPLLLFDDLLFYLVSFFYFILFLFIHFFYFVFCFELLSFVWSKDYCWVRYVAASLKLLITIIIRELLVT